MAGVPTDLIPLAEAARLLPGRGCEHPRRSTLLRWCRDGVQRQGRTVRLRCWRVGCRWFTSTAAIAEFIAGDDRGSEPARSPAKRAKDSEKAAAELDRLWGKK